MPARRDSRSASPSQASPPEAVTPPRRRLPRLPRWRLRWPRRERWLQASVAGAGVLVGLNLIGLVWPERDRAASEGTAEITPATLADKPRRPVTVLLIGLDSDSLGAPSNGAAPAGPANADTLLLVRVQPRGPLQLLNLPTELAVRLPGEKKPVALGSLYRRGGVALTADAVRELTGLHAPAPDRYVVLPRGALRDLINGIGGLEVDPPRTLRYRDRAQKLTIDLQGGLQRLGGQQVEHLVRYRDRWLGPADRRRTQQQVTVALRERLQQSGPLASMPAVLRSLQDKVDTNLTPFEALSLMAAGLDDSRPIAFAALPLDPPRPAHGALRQLSAKAPRQVWPDKAPGR
ncbi:MAG: LCP family protein [Cyanobium sp.]